MARPSRRHCSRTLSPSMQRQADVEHHRVVGLGVAEEVPFLAVERGIDDIAGVAQRFRELGVEVLVVLDDENAHVGLSSPEC